MENTAPPRRLQGLARLGPTGAGAHRHAGDDRRAGDEFFTRFTRTVAAFTTEFSTGSHEQSQHLPQKSRPIDTKKIKGTHIRHRMLAIFSGSYNLNYLIRISDAH